MSTHGPIELLYFARVREAIGKGSERVFPPASVSTVADLIGWLARSGAPYAEAFADTARLRAAIDNEFVGFDATIDGAHEIALFPPVTGG